MPILHITFGSKISGLFRQVFFAVLIKDELIAGGARLLRYTQRIGTHIGDQTDCAEPLYIHAFIQFLSGFHRSSCLKREPS